MGRKKLRNKIASIIVHVENEFAEFKLNSNEDFEMPMNQINQNVNHINKKIAKILNNNKHNSTFSSYKQNQDLQEKTYQRDTMKGSFESEKKIKIYDMVINKNFDFLMNQASVLQKRNIEIEKTDMKDIENCKSSISEKEEEITNEKDDIFSFMDTENNQINTKSADGNSQYLIDEQYNLTCLLNLDEGENQGNVKTSDFEDYITSLNNIFIMNR